MSVRESSFQGMGSYLVIKSSQHHVMDFQARLTDKPHSVSLEKTPGDHIPEPKCVLVRDTTFSFL